MPGQSSKVATSPSLRDAFEKHAADRTDATALVFGRRSMTYGELNARANQVARRLIMLGAGKENCVAVAIERSTDYVIAILAILKSGAAFVPIDLDWPTNRVGFVLRDCAASACITAGSSREFVATQTLSLDLVADADAISNEPADCSPGVSIAPENLAYVIYTSGSTGHPKGVMIEHGAIAAHINSISRVYGITCDDRCLLFHSMAFDPSIEQVFCPLTVGGSVVIRGNAIWSGADFIEEIQTQGITVATLPSAYWLQLLRDWKQQGVAAPIGRLRQVIVGGEALPPAAVELWRNMALTSIRFLNDYGPTECAITATVHAIPPEASPAEANGRIPIGKPHGPVHAHILGEDGKPAERGQTGELCLSGPTLARGYLGHDGLTRERFVSHPYDPTVRIYRTGDLACENGDGTLDFLGRADDQVKIRGFRVELGEVETALRGISGIDHAGVAVLDKGDADRHLVAFFVAAPDTALEPREIRRKLAEVLPSAAVPAILRSCGALPLTTNGKLDRARLAADASRFFATTLSDGFMSGTSVEDAVARAWRTSLGLASIDHRANVFELGATSLTVTRVHRQLESSLGYTVSIALLFQHTTVADLASTLLQPKQPAAVSTLTRARQQRAVMRERRRRQIA